MTFKNIQTVITHILEVLYISDYLPGSPAAFVVMVSAFAGWLPFSSRFAGISLMIERMNMTLRYTCAGPPRSRFYFSSTRNLVVGALSRRHD